MPKKRLEMVAKLALVTIAVTLVLTETYGGCFYDKNGTSFRCALIDNNISVNFNTSHGVKIGIECQKTTRIACTEFGIVKKYINDYFGNWTKTIGILKMVDVDRCDVNPGRIKCLLDLVGASDTDTLHLRHMSLLPEDLVGVKFLKTLRIYDDDTPRIPYKALSLLPDLQSYTMRDGKLMLQPEQDLLPNLRNLELVRCEIKFLPKAAFVNTPNIQNLFLWGNRIEYVDVDAFEGLKNLVNVSLNDNLISHLPGGLFRHTPHVEGVFFHGNKLIELTENVFNGLQELKLVTLFNNTAPLTLQDRAFSNLPSLYSLDLKNSFIANLTDDLFYNTTNLKILLLSGNKLKTIPRKLLTNIKLTILNLNDNILEYLPVDAFKDQTSLKTLNLDGNVLQSLPTGIFSNLKRLKKLDLRRNSLTSLVKNEFRGMNRLEDLLLDDNKITNIDKSVFENVLTLKVLSLAGNNITISEKTNTYRYTSSNRTFSIYISPMHKLYKLKKLHLSRNNILIMCQDWREMYFLEELDLSHNGISYLSSNDMTFPASVRVNLQNNRIHYFVPYNGRLNSVTPTFLLNHNPYICDCKLYDLTQMYNTPKVMKSLVLDYAVCSQPRALKGRKLTDLKADTLICESDCSDSSQNLQNISTGFPKFQICSSCIELPSKSLLEMSCQSFPNTYPKLKPGQTISIKLENSTNIPKLPKQIQYIDLSHLNVTKPPESNSSGQNITLNLTKNSLTRAPIELLKNDFVLLLRDNPFECTCGTQNDIYFLKKYSFNIKDFEQLTCSDGNLLINKDVDQLCTVSNVTIIIFTISVILLIVAICAILYKFNTQMRIWLRKYDLWFERLNPNINYDAYFTFAPDDENRLRANEIPALEGGKPPLRLYLHYKHFQLGGYIPDEIAQAVEDSHWTIIALSNKYLESKWNSLELKLAHNKEKIIFLLLDDISEMSLDKEIKKLLSLYPVYYINDKLACEKIRNKILRGRKNTNNDVGHSEKI